jgi:hypothetical protein
MNEPSDLPDDLAALYAAERPLPEVAPALRARVLARVRASTGAGGVPLGPKVLVAIVAVAGAGAWLVTRRPARPGRVAETATDLVEAPERSRAQPPRLARRLPIFTPPAGSATAGPKIPTWFAQPGLSAREIAGKVVRDGQPAAGVEVVLESQVSAANPALRQRTTSRPDGTFTFGPQPPGPYGLTAYAPGSEPAHLWVDPRNPLSDPRPDRLLVTIAACGTTVSGLVTDQAAGTQLAGARVVVLPARNPGRLVGPATVTGSSGDYQLCVPPGELRLRVEANGYATALALATADERRDFQLVTESILRGTTVDSESGAPLGDVQINAWPLGDGEPAAGPSTTLTDAEGRFELRGLRPHTRYTINAWRSDFISDEPMTVDVMPGATAGLVRRLAAATRVEGVVRQQGRALAGARVRIDRPPYAASFTSISQADGRFTLHGVPRGSDTVVVEGFRVLAPNPLEVPASGRRDVAIEVEPLKR